MGKRIYRRIRISNRDCSLVTSYGQKKMKTANILQPKPGFDWSKVQWGAPDAPETDFCSYCGKPFPRDYSEAFRSYATKAEADAAIEKLRARVDAFMPLILWKKDGSAAEFCDECQKQWFGIWSPEGEPPE